MNEMQELLEKIGAVTEDINVDRVFGEPRQVGETVLIPVAQLSYGVGMGMGAGEGFPEEAPEGASEGAEEAAVGFGGGGGAGAKARPIAYIEVGPEGTKVQSIMDEQKIALAGILLSVWAVGWLGLVLKTLFSPHD
jgi:uncharacterized spore protein YtfJ